MKTRSPFVVALLRVVALWLIAYIFAALYNSAFFSGIGWGGVALQLYASVLSYAFLWCCTHLKYAGLPLYMLCCALFSILAMANWEFGYDFVPDMVSATLETNTEEASAFFTVRSMCVFAGLMVLNWGLFEAFRRISRKLTAQWGKWGKLACLAGMAACFGIVFMLPTIVFFRILGEESDVSARMVATLSDNTIRWHPFFHLDNERPPFETMTRSYRKPFSHMQTLKKGLVEYFTDVEFDESAAAPSREEDPGKDIICVLAVGESIRADHLGLNGYARQTTPRLAGIPHLYSLSYMLSYEAATDKSLCGIMTGLIADNSRLRSSFLSILRKHAYTCTYCTENADDMSKTHRNKAIIGDYLNSVRSLKGSVAGVTGDFVRCLPESGKHFILFQNGTGHYPYKHDKEFCEYEGDASAAQLTNDYDNCILSLDAMYSAMIAGLKDKNAVLIFCSDHAEGMGENGKWHHGDASNPVLRRVASFIWFSDTFIECNPELVNRIIAVKDKPMVQGQLFATILKLCGIHSDTPLDIGDIVEDDIRKHPDNNLPFEIQQELAAPQAAP